MENQYLQIEGASIYYEVEGTGPYLIFVPGGDGGGVIFKPLRSHLIKHFTVVIYDRRGYGKSRLTGPQDYKNRLDTEADDIYTLMRSLTNQKFTLFGSSSGGAVSSKYFAKYPETLQIIFLHEPMVNVSVLSEGKELGMFHKDIHDIYKTKGQDAALEIYARKYLNDTDYRRTTSKQLGDKEHSWGVHLEHEVHVYCFYDMNMEIIGAYKDKLVLTYGIKSFDTLIYRLVHSISKCLNKELISLPGGHVGYVAETEKFATEFLNLFAKQSLMNSTTKL